MYKNFLIAGATGGSGRELIKELLTSNKNVSIIVRNKTKAKSFLKEDYEKITNVIEVELGIGEAIKNEELAKAIRETDCLISALGTALGQNPKICDYDSIKELIEISERENLKKFVFITSLYITRPLSFVAFMLNNVIPYVLGWKSLAENKLRLSKLNYMIVRPGQLVDKVDLEKSVGVFQGDRVKGKISRNFLAQAIIKSLDSPNLNKDKVTLDMVEIPKTENFLEIDKNSYKILEDDDNSIIIKDHFRVTRSLNMIFFSVFILSMIYLFYKFK